MDIIRKWFEDDNEKYEIEEYDGHLEARTKTILFMIVAPHSGTKGRWMLRVSTISAFDRWANSTAVEEFFSTDIGIYNYLVKHKIDIYDSLINYLSEEYDELWNEFVREN